MLTFSNPRDFNQPKLRLCRPPRSPHKYARPLSLKLRQLCCSRGHHSAERPRCSAYLLRVTVTASFSCALASLCLLARHPPRGQPSFQEQPESRGGSRVIETMVGTLSFVFVLLGGGVQARHGASGAQVRGAVVALCSRPTDHQQPRGWDAVGAAGRSSAEMWGPIGA